MALLLPGGYSANILGKKPNLVGALGATLGNKVVPTANPVDPWAEATARAQALSAPYLNALTQQQSGEEAAARAASAQRQKDLEASYAAQVPMIDNSYGKAIASTSAIEDAVSKHLASAGDQATSDLANRLKAVGAPGTEADIANLGQIYKGAGGAEFATGTSGIQTLIGNQAAAQEALSKQKISDINQIGKDLTTAISGIAKDYGVKRDEVLANMPTQIQNIYAAYQDQQKTAESTREFNITAAENKREYNQGYGYQKAKDLQDRMDNRHKLALETKLTMQQTMSAADYKRWAKKFDANQKALDRQSREQIAAANREASQASKIGGQNLTGPSSQQYITVQDSSGNPVVIKNPNYVPKSKKTATASSADTVDTAGSAKRNRAYDSALSSVFNKNSGKVRDVVIYAQDPNMKALKLINAALKGMGVDPYSAAGNQIRQSIWGFLDGKSGGNAKGGSGTFTDPRKDDPRFKKTKKKK